MILSRRVLLASAAVLALLGIAYWANLGNIRYYIWLARCDQRPLIVGKKYGPDWRYNYREKALWRNPLEAIWRQTWAPERFFCAIDDTKLSGYSPAVGVLGWDKPFPESAVKSVHAVRPGDELGPFILRTLRFNEENITANFSGQAVILARCGYPSDVFGYECIPEGSSENQIPRFVEIDGGKISSFSVIPGDPKVFSDFKTLINNHKGPDGYSELNLPLQITISDYVIRYGGTAIGPSAKLVEVMKQKS